MRRFQIRGRKIQRQSNTVPTATKRTALLLVIAILANPFLSVTSWGFPTNADMRSCGDESVGLPARVFAEKSIPTLAREMLLQRHLETDAVTSDSKSRGFQVELFAPGDIGITVRYRW